MTFDCIVPENTKPKEGYGFIYCYTLDNGKQYIGQTSQSLRTRHRGHICQRGKKAIPDFDVDLNTHKFHLFVVGEYPKEILSRKESDFIRIFNTFRPNGYNVASSKTKDYSVGGSYKIRRLSRKNVVVSINMYEHKTYKDYRDSLILDLLMHTSILKYDVSFLKWKDIIISDGFYLQSKNEKIYISNRIMDRFVELHQLSKFNSDDDFIFCSIRGKLAGTRLNPQSLGEIVHKCTTVR